MKSIASDEQHRFIHCKERGRGRERERIAVASSRAGEAMQHMWKEKKNAEMTPPLIIIPQKRRLRHHSDHNSFFFFELCTSHHQVNSSRDLKNERVSITVLLVVKFWLPNCKKRIILARLFCFQTGETQRAKNLLAIT